MAKTLHTFTLITSGNAFIYGRPCYLGIVLVFWLKINDDAIETGPNVQITIHQTPAINKTRDTNAAINCKSR